LPEGILQAQHHFVSPLQEALEAATTEPSGVWGWAGSHKPKVTAVPRLLSQLIGKQSFLQKWSQSACITLLLLIFFQNNSSGNNFVK